MLFTESFQTGGTERFVLRTATHLDRARFEVHIGCFSEQGAFRVFVPDYVPVHVFPYHPAQPPQVRLAALAGLVRCLHRLRVDLLVTSHSYINTRVGIAAALSGIRLVTGRRGQLTPDRLRDRTLARLADRLAACVIANSRSLAEEIIREERLRPEKVELVYNGLPAPETGDPFILRERVRGELGLAGNDRLLVCLARISPEKGHPVLLEALALLAARRLRPTLLLLGGGDIAGILEQARHLGIADQILAYGDTERPWPFLCAADIFVLPSLTESFPNALLEGMQAGLPCIASDVGGVAEVLTDGETGLLVAPGQPQPLCDALARLLADPELAARLAKSAGQRVAEDFTLEHMIAALERIFIRASGGPHDA